MMPDELWDFVRTIESAVTREEAEALYRKAFEVGLSNPRTFLVEIGCWQGRSTVVLGEAIQQANAGSKSNDRCKLVAIDPYDGVPDQAGGRAMSPQMQALERNLLRAGLADTVQFVRSYSEDVAGIWQTKWNAPVSFLFIDGNHDYDAVKKDFECWEPLLAPKAVVAFHDRDFPGPKKVIEEVTTGTWRWKIIKTAGQLAFLKSEE